MLKEKNKITIRQIVVMFVISTLSPAIRLFPRDCSLIGRGAAWLAPILSVVPFALLCVILNSFFQNKSLKSLSDVFEASFGKIIGKAVGLLYLFWCMILYFLYLRYYAERLLSSIFPNTDIRFFIAIMLPVVFCAARGSIETLARFGELIFLLFNMVMVVFFLLLSTNVKIENLFPITQYDLLPAAKATYPVVGIWGYLTLLFFLGKSVVNKEQFKKPMKRGLIFLTVITTLLMIVVVGSLGYQVAQRMPLPFFNSVKLITFLQTFDRLESVLLSIWVVSDFFIISLFAVIIQHIVKNLFAASESKYFASPVVLLGYVGSLALARDRFELENFSNTVGLTVNIAVCFGLPAVAWCVGRLRKKL